MRQRENVLFCKLPLILRRKKHKNKAIQRVAINKHIVQVYHFYIDQGEGDGAMWTDCFSLWENGNGHIILQTNEWQQSLSDAHR